METPEQTNEFRIRRNPNNTFDLQRKYYDLNTEGKLWWKKQFHSMNWCDIDIHGERVIYGCGLFPMPYMSSFNTLGAAEYKIQSLLEEINRPVSYYYPCEPTI